MAQDEPEPERDWDKLARDLRLSGTQRRFAEAWAVAFAADPNVTATAVQRSVDPEGQSAGTASVRGNAKLRNPRVKAYISALLGDAAASARTRGAVMGAREVMERLSEQARADLGDHLRIRRDGSHEVRLNRKRTKTLRSIETVKRSPDGTVRRDKIQVSDPVPPLRSLARIYGLETPDQPGPPPVQIRVELLRQLPEADLRQLLPVMERLERLAARPEGEES